MIWKDRLAILSRHKKYLVSYYGFASGDGVVGRGDEQIYAEFRISDLGHGVSR